MFATVRYCRCLCTLVQVLAVVLWYRCLQQGAAIVAWSLDNTFMTVLALGLGKAITCKQQVEIAKSVQRELLSKSVMSSSTGIDWSHSA